MNRRALLLGGLATVAASLEVRAGGELYGRPLRGLTPVPIAELSRDPGRYAGRTLAIRGTVRAGEKGEIVIEEAGASIRVLSDGTYSLPQELSGSARCEGKLGGGASSGDLKFVASGVELSR